MSNDEFLVWLDGELRKITIRLYVSVEDINPIIGQLGALETTKGRLKQIRARIRHDTELIELLRTFLTQQLLRKMVQ